LVAVQSYFETNIEEDVWRKILKPVAEDCLRTLMPNWKEKEAKIEFPPFNLKKNECNPLAMSFNTCITLEAFKVSRPYIAETLMIMVIAEMPSSSVD
jgi:hypothetical protein